MTGTPPRRQHLATLVRFAAGWLAAGLFVAVGLALLIHDDHPRGGARPDAIAAVARSGCVLEQPRGLRARVMRPPVGGRGDDAAASGPYSRSPSRAALVGALRHGRIVIQYTPGLRVEWVGSLERTFGRGGLHGVVTPDATGMPFAVAATAWGRILGCSKIDGHVLTALRAFARRYAGTGPGM